MRSVRILLMLGAIAILATTVNAQTLASKVMARQPLLNTGEKVIPLKEALSKLEAAYQVHIVYDDEVVEGRTAPDLGTISEDFQEDLEYILGEHPVAYEKVGARTIVLTPKEAPPLPEPQATGTIRGKIIDAETGEGIPAAQVLIEGTTMGAAADNQGQYVIFGVPAGTYTLRTQVIGYSPETASVTVRADETVTQDFSLTVDILDMDAIVVTGTPGGAGVRKREASFAITTMDELEIRQFSPSSTANLLELVPGVWSESSGGVAGANIFVRGMPSSGDAPFVTIAINGGPVYGVETLSFLEQSTLFRIDETVEWSEALRGGPSAVFSNAEPGMTVNFNLRKGGEATKGRVKYQTSDYSLQRVDAFLSGKVTEGLYYMIGGYARTSPGVRSMEFNGENGKQLTLQLTKIYGRGVLNAFTRLTDDYGQWVLPMALRTGNDLGTYTPLGNATRFRELQINKAGDTKIFDFSRGRGWKGNISGINANFDLGAGWTVRDNLTYTSGEANTFGFVPNGNPIQVSALGRDVVRTRGGQILKGSDYVQNYGHWVVLKDLESITNDLSLARKWEKHDITVGLYQARWSAADFWTLGNHVPVHNVANGDLLQEDITADTLAAYGGGGPWNFGLQSGGDARVFAIYGADSWQVMPALRIDLGVRQEWFDLQYTLDTGPGYPDGTTDMAKSLSGKDLAITAAANYDVTEELGVFARFSDSYLFPHFDMIREGTYSVDADGNIEANEFSQFEFGVKYDSRNLSLFATGFFNNVDVFDGDVGAARESALLKTQTYGVELDGAFSYEDFTLRAVGTFQKGEIKEADLDPTVVGNSIWRQPDWQVRVSPSYNMALGKNFAATIYGAFRAVGKRWDSRGNVFQLDGYTKIDVGAVVSAPAGLSFGIHVDNLTDSEGLTEGDPRDPTAANGRPIFGRSVKLSVTHDF
jgi:outer membrane cobalamin receptor